MADEEQKTVLFNRGARLGLLLFLAFFFGGCATMEHPETGTVDADHVTGQPEKKLEIAPLFPELPEGAAAEGVVSKEAATKPTEAERDVIGEKIEERLAENLARKKIEKKRTEQKSVHEAITELEHGHKLRVRVIDGRKTIRVNGAKGTGNGVNITRLGAAHAKVNRKKVELPIHLTPVKNFIYLNGRPYRGVVDIYAAEAGLMAVNELYVEPYIVGLINHEISSKWPEAAVKAQAVVARTYALHEKQRNRNLGLDDRFDIDGSVLGQVYRGANGEDDFAVSAVRETEGQVLTYRGKLALTVYHSNAGGFTESSANVWGTGYPYLRSVKSEYDKGSPGYSWRYAITPQRLALRLKRAGFKVGKPEELTVIERTGSGRVFKIEVLGAKEPVIISGKEFRAAIGYDFIKSTRFNVSRSGSVFSFTGTGLGHGVGMSQWGARGMAAAGYSYKEILRHYYPGTSLGIIR